ncbi:MAG TPA: amidohydrolase family protein, partial [bacterium]|nr:amidohydrolase family protein [bacterium]
HIFPGAIDPHVHFDEPGFTEREDFYHGSCAAASGGITTVIDMPCTSLPPVTTLENLKNKLEIVQEKSVIDFGFFGGVSNQTYSDKNRNMEELANWVLGFKNYFISGMDSFQHLDHYQFLEVLKYSEKINRPILLHAEDLSYVKKAELIESKKGDNWINYYRSRPEVAEIMAVQNALTLASTTNADLHIVHLGTAAAANLLANHKNVSGETAPHYLEFETNDLEKIGGALKTAPVVKPKGNAEELWKLLKKGTINFIASDHAPAPNSQKNTGSAWQDYAGIPGSGTLFPYFYSEGYRKRDINLADFLRITSEGAARRYGIFDRKGSIAEGKDADLILLNSDAKWTVKGKEFFSKGKITPFEEYKFQGRIEKTLVQGKVVFDHGRGFVQKPGTGQFIKR